MSFYGHGADDTTNWSGIGLATLVCLLLGAVIWSFVMLIISIGTYEPYVYKNGQKVHHLQVEQDKYGFIYVPEEDGNND
jgi:hypothetical protein